MANKYLIGTNASVLGEEPNMGVKGMRSFTRTDSDALRTFENPQDNLVAKEFVASLLTGHSILTKRSEQGLAKQIWGSEDEAEIARKHANWKLAREKQEHDMQRVLTLQDGLKAAAVWFLVRQILHRFGLSFRRIMLPTLLIGLGQAIYRARAKPKRFKPDVDFTHFPIIGQIGIVPHMIERGLANMQMERSRLKDYRTDEVQILGNPRDLALMDPRDREYVLKTNWRNFVKNGPDGTGFQENFAEVMGRGIFAVDGDEWQDHRKVASHLFSANGLRSKMETSFTVHGKKLVEMFETKLHSGSTFDFQDAMANLTFETICDIAFGVEPGAMEAGILNGKKIDFLTRFDRVQQTSTLRFVIPGFIWKTMRFLNIGSERVLREDAIALNSYVRDIIHKRRADADFETADDLLAMYVRTGKSTGKGYMTEEDYLIDAILNFMIAGRDTTSCTLTNVFKLLPTNPEVEVKMLEELDRVVGRGRAVSWDHIRELRYCGAVFNEVLRLYPPVAGDSRTVMKDDLLPSGITVESGQRVSFLNAAIGRDPHLWDKSDSFLPERWLQEGKPTRRPDEYIFPVFWGGPRLCLGKDMARLETISITYAVLAKYRVEILPHREKTVNGPVQFYEGGLPAKLHLRQ